MLKTKGFNFKENVRLVFFFGSILLVLSTLVTMPRVSFPLMVGYIIYLIVNPAIPALEKIGINRTWAVLGVFSSLMFFSIYPIVKVVPTVSKEIENVQYYIPKVEGYVKVKYEQIRDEIRDRTGYEMGDSYIIQGIDYVRKATTSILLNVPKIVANVLEWIFLVPLYIFFFLKDGPSFKRIVLKLTPNSIFERFYQLSHKFNRQLGDYIFAKFVEASIVGIIITTGLLILDVRFALLLGLIAAITNIIPYAGPVIGFVPGLLFGLAEYGGGATLGAVVLLYVIANAIDIAFVFPILVSKIVDLHPILVVISVILGSQYMGIIGMIISIPLAAAAKLIFQEFYKEFYQSRY